MVANDDTVMTVNLPSGPIAIPQVALLKRTQTTDFVTGQVTYGPWSTD